MTTPPPSPPPVFTTTIHLPPYRLTIDETKFLRLLCHCPVLSKAEKRQIIETVPRLQQHQVDLFIERLEEEAEKDRSWPPSYQEEWQRICRRVVVEWRELEQELKPL